MSIKPDAWEHIEKKLKERLGGDKSHKDWQKRREFLLREQLSDAKGREFFYEYVSNAAALKLEAYTGNASTYYILGYQKWAKILVEEAKKINLPLFHQMEIEAIQREEDKR